MGYHAPVSRVGRQLGMARTWLSERVERRIYLFPSPPLFAHYILATLHDLYFVPKERVRKSQSAFKLFPMHRKELDLLNILRLHCSAIIKYFTVLLKKARFKFMHYLYMVCNDGEDKCSIRSAGCPRTLTTKRGILDSARRIVYVTEPRIAIHVLSQKYTVSHL